MKRLQNKLGLIFFLGFLGIGLLWVDAGESQGESLIVADQKASELNRFQIEEEQNILRLVISGNGKIETYRTHILSQPLRFVVDIPNVTLPEPKEFIPMIHPLIDVIRFEINPQKIRIIFEFKSVDIPRYRIYQRNHTLIISIET